MTRWKRFTDNNQVGDPVNSYFEDIDNPAYQSGTTPSDHHGEKRIGINRDYVEK